MSWQQFKHAWLIKFWAPIPAVIAAGILSTYYFGITGTFWAVTGEFTRWGGQLLQLFGVHAEEWGYFKIIHLEGSPLTRIDGMMILGMFGGCFAAALWANNVKLRMPRSRIRIMQAIIGGIIAGFGARLAMGCNLAAFFTGIPQFSLHAWFFAIATAIGSWFGARFTLLPIFRIPVKMQKVSAASPLTQKPDQARRRFRLGMLVFFGMLGWALLTAMNQPKLGLAMLFGVGFGLLIERAQICFTSAFRDMWITGRTHMAKAIIIGMAVSAIGIFSYVQLGNVIGSTILAYYWDDFAPALATDWDKINLLKTFGPMGGLLVTYLLLFAALMLIIGWEKRFFRRAAPQIAKEIA